MKPTVPVLRSNWKVNNGHSANGLQLQDTGSRGRKACSARETEDSLSYLTQKDRFKYNKIMAGHGLDEKGRKEKASWKRGVVE